MRPRSPDSCRLNIRTGQQDFDERLENRAGTIMKFHQRYCNFVYTPLESPKHVRLIQVEELGEPGSLTRISFRSTSLDQPCRYQTLSYTWGQTFADDSHLTDVILCEGRELHITPILNDFFQQLRDKLRNGKAAELPVWIDAISINQKDANERAQQVAMMANIYRNSHHLIIWLGQLDIYCSFRHFLDRFERDKAGYWDADSVHTESENEDAPEMTKFSTKLDSAERQKLLDLVRLPWFRRRWVIQEMLHTSQSDRTIWIGSREVPWSLFAAAVVIGKVSYLAGPVFRLLLIAYIKKHNKDKPSQSLLQNLESSDNAECADNRDRIYALLSVSSDGQDFEVDYTLDTETVYRRVIERYIQNQQPGYTLQLLVSATARLTKGRAPALPSWVADWCNPAEFVTQEHEECFNECLFGGLPVGLEFQRQPNFRALVHDRCLHLSGWLFPECNNMLPDRDNSCGSGTNHAESSIEPRGQVRSLRKGEKMSSTRRCLDCMFPQLEQVKIFQSYPKHRWTTAEQTLCLLDGSKVAFILSTHGRIDESGRCIYRLETCLLVNPVWNEDWWRARIGEPTTVIIE